MLFKNDKAVSPVVATLVLVVVAIIGAAAVGVILGTFSSDVSDQASSDNTKDTASSEILVAGSTTVQPVSELIAKVYMEKNPGVKVTVSGGGSDAGIAGAGMGSIDVGAASKYLSNDNKNKFPELEEHVIGGSAVVVIANSADALTSISRANLVTLYDDVQDNAAGVTAGCKVVQRTEGSGTEETFAGYIITDAKNVDGAKDDTGTVTTTQVNRIGNQGVVDYVGANANSIGFVDYGFANGNTKVKMLTITDGTASYDPNTGNNVKDTVKLRLANKGASTTDKYAYDLCRPLVYLTNGETSAVVNNYVNFAASPATIDCFADAGYWSITELQ